MLGSTHGMSKKKKSTISRRKAQIIYGFSALLLTLVLFSLFLSFLFQQKVLLNVYLADRSYSGLTASQASAALDDDLASRDVIFELEDNKINVNLDDLGIYYDKNSTLSSLYSYGSTGDVVSDFKVRLLSPFVKIHFEPVYTVDFEKFSTRIDEELQGMENKAQNAKIIAKGSEFIILPAKGGMIVDRATLFSEIKSRTENLNDAHIAIQLLDDQPTISDEQIQQPLAKLKNISKQRIVLSFGYDKWSLSGDTLLGVLNTDKWEQIGQNNIDFMIISSPITLSNLQINESSESVLDVSFDGEKIDEFVGTIAKSVNRPARDATIRFEGGKVVEFSAAVDGQALDSELLKSQILEKIDSIDPEQSAQINIEIPVAIARAKIANSEINSLGITELIGKGVSYFTGSIPNRAFNIGLGSRTISGTLVKPGEIFSFNGLVGPVSAEQGYKQAYIINKGRTVLDDGGGICQVSTTAFRAALNAGLPIVKRTAHAYRVSYYEQRGFKPGLDATIFSPSVDLQFKNDTSHSILVQAVVDSVNGKLEVDIYGTSDGRRVVLGDVVVSNIKPAPEPLYQDDPSLATGTTKQVDFAAAGATAVFTRKVYRGSELLIDESFKSNFRPWQAVYLVGKG